MYKRLFDTSIGAMGLFSLWIWVAFLWINAAASRPTGYVVGQFCIWDGLVLAGVALGGGAWIYRWPAQRRANLVALTAVSYIGLCAFLFFAGHPAATSSIP